MTTQAAKNATPASGLDAAYLESLFQGARLAILACAPDGTVAAWNSAAAKLFEGVGSSLQPHSPVHSAFPEHCRGEVQQQLDAVLSTHEPAEFRVRLGGTEAEPIEYGVYITPVQETEGGVRGVAVWLRDITTRTRLLRMVKKRERLTNLGALCGAVAHHYNNLLCSIATSVEYALNMNTMTAMRRALQRSTSAITRAADITHQLLVFAQADHRGGDLADLTESVLYFFDENEARLAQRHIKLDLDWQPIPTVPVLRKHLLVVLGNLIDNAIEAMPSGGTLHARLAPLDKKRVKLSITDTGGGMRSEDLEHVFEPFHTSKGELGAGTTRNAGMGLAVVHGLVSEMHASITVSNVPGKGARFDIVFPVTGDI